MFPNVAVLWELELSHHDNIHGRLCLQSKTAVRRQPRRACLATAVRPASILSRFRVDETLLAAIPLESCPTANRKDFNRYIQRSSGQARFPRGKFPHVLFRLRAPRCLDCYLKRSVLGHGAAHLEYQHGTLNDTRRLVF